MSADMLDDALVAVALESKRYAGTAPFHPSESMPEWPSLQLGQEDNPAYRGVRRLLHALGMDSEHYGGVDWNPLSTLIKAGDTVILKPNLVSHRNLGERMYGVTDTDSLVTHGSVIRAVLDYVGKALSGSGRVIICDCPVQGTDWDEVLDLVGLPSVAADFCERFPGTALELIDFRLGKAVRWRNTVVKRIIDEEARALHSEVDLKTRSLLMPLMQGSYAFGVSDYPRYRMAAAHTQETNKYLFPNDLLKAQVVINLPKMKVHMKAGITCSLKNFVGTVGHKDYLPHFRFGGPRDGGDEYPDLGRLWKLLWSLMHKAWDYEGGRAKLAYIAAARACALMLRFQPSAPRPVWALGSGSWHGNDTLWRTVLDINRAFHYCDPSTCEVQEALYPSRKHLAILDGIVAGEKESPLAPTPRPTGILMAAVNPLALDTVAAALMGFDYRRIKQLRYGWDCKSLPLANFTPQDICIVGNSPASTLMEAEAIGGCKPFIASMGFRGMVELKNDGAKAP